MRRRALLIGTAALAAPVPAWAGDEPTAASWTLPVRSGRLEITLRGISLDCDWIPPGRMATERRDSPPLLLAGPARVPVNWRVERVGQDEADALGLLLRATELPLRAEMLFYHHAPTGLVGCRTTLRHDGDGPPIEVHAPLSFALGVHEPASELLTLRGVWAQESRVRFSEPYGTPVVLESRTGKTGFDAQPYAALIGDDAVTLCEMGWSGNWRMDILLDRSGAMISGGLNPWRLRHRLLPGSHLTLPAAGFGRVEGDLNRATQALHDLRRAFRPDRDRPIPVQFNSWYPYFGNPTAPGLLALVPKAHRLGCEVFVVDAGWYRTDQGESDEDWEARIGDWRTSRTRFPNGLVEISTACAALDMRFGLWFEPESIGRLSSVRTRHPEWLHWIDGQRPVDPTRAVLNLGVPAARVHVLQRLTRMIAAVGVGWVKWDFNTDLGAGGWAPGLPAKLTAQDPIVAHVEGLYAVQDALRARFPNLVLEMCASGGSRLDGAILSHAHVNWVSDQPSPLRKLAIHFGTQIAHPAVVCNDWLVEWPPGAIAGYDDDTPDLAKLGNLPFRLHVAMLGSFGISARVDRWSDADTAVVADHVALYRTRLRRIIHHGDQYLLAHRPNRSGRGDWAAIWYVAKDGAEGVLFAFRLEGADETRRYALPGLREGVARATWFPDRPLPIVGGGVEVTLKQTFRSALVLVNVPSP